VHACLPTTRTPTNKPTPSHNPHRSHSNTTPTTKLKPNPPQTPAGDSRAILVQRGARAVALSRDHKPSLPDETKRITDLGGKVIFWGRWRVEGILAVSRAIGDRHLKPYVTPEPEVCEWALTDRDCFLVLATDGIWCVGGWVGGW
jgi:hypothetical protein